MIIFKYSLLRSVRSRLSILINFIAPFGLVFAGPLWTEGHRQGFFFLGMLLMYGGFLLARNVITDRADGVLVRIFAGPVTTLQYLAQNLLAYFLIMALQIGVIVAMGAALYRWDISFTLGLLLCYIAFASASLAFTLAWGCLFKNKELSYTIFSLAISLIACLCGLWFPLSMLPDILRYLGMLFPAYWMSNGITILLSGGMGSEFWMSILAIMLFTAAYLLYGSKRRIL